MSVAVETWLPPSSLDANKVFECRTPLRRASQKEAYQICQE
uniref:Uncharacterized protein n=1 Tax=Tetraselmis sp. GSL018 TaxID=582737 RepID=A0A061RMI9_9CHLO